jgi:hypothetical protein
MLLKLVVSENETTHCQRLLEHEVTRSLGSPKRVTIGYQGGSLENKVYFSKGLWYSKLHLASSDVAIPRHWNAFGTEERKDRNQIIVVEINPPLKGRDARVQGAFGKNEIRNQYYLLHRGGFGGGRKGIGREAFQSWYRGAWTELSSDDGPPEEAILIGPLGVGGLMSPLRTFVHDVAAFKREASEGKLSRKPQYTREMLIFSPEPHGRRRGKRKSVFDYESYHGAVVNALADRLRARQPGASIFNTRFIDLGVERSRKLAELYEVKSSADSQSIYSGVGQLVVHSEGDSSVRRILVLPSDELSPALTMRLKKLDIETVGYRIRAGKVSFSI